MWQHPYNDHQVCLVQVIITSPSLQRASAAARSIMATATNSSSVVKHSVMALECDLGNPASVRRCASELLTKARPPTTLINNAGVAVWSYQETPLGIEANFGINHLGHFLLTEVTVLSHDLLVCLPLNDAAHQSNCSS